MRSSTSCSEDASSAAVGSSRKMRIGVGRQRPRHEHTLSLPAREIAKLPPRQRLDARLRQRGAGAAEVRPRVRQRHIVGPLQAHEHEVQDRDREDGVEGRLLRNVSQAEARPALDGAADGMREPEGRADEGRLAGAVRPDDGPQLPRADRERERGQDRDAVVPDGERPRVQEALPRREAWRGGGRCGRAAHRRQIAATIPSPVSRCEASLGAGRPSIYEMDHFTQWCAISSGF